MALNIVPCCNAADFLAFVDPKSCICGDALSIHSDYCSLFIHALC